MKWLKIPLEEQELIMNINYENKNINFYVTRKIVANKLKKVLGEPKVSYQNNYITSYEWVVPFNLRNIIRSALSINILLMKSNEGD